MAYYPLAPLLVAAISSNNYDRSQAQLQLQMLRSSNCQQFVAQLLQLLYSQEECMHILAYSQILNGILLKNNRANRILNNFVINLQNVYLQFWNMDLQQITLGRRRHQMQIQNIIRLAVTFLCQSNYSKQREEMLVHFLKLKTNSSYRSLLVFYRRIFQGMIQILLFELRVRVGSSHSTFVTQVLEELSHDEGLQSLRMMIALSYFLPIFPSFLFVRFVNILKEDNHLPEEIVLKTVVRLAVLMENKHTPPLENAIQLFGMVKSLAQRVSLRNIQKNNLIDILRLIQGSLTSIFRNPINEISESMMLQTVLNFNSFGQLLDWLLKVSTFQQQDSQQQLYSPMSKIPIQIIRIYSQRMPDQQLQLFFERVRSNINKVNQQSILCLLYGGSRNILELFGCEQIVLRLLTGTISISSKGSFIYYLFLHKYLKMSYMLSQDEFRIFYNFLLQQINLHQNILRNTNIKEQEQHHTLKLSILFTSYAQLTAYPWVKSYQNYQSFFIDKIFYYLAHSYLGMPEAAHQNLLQAILQVIYRNNVSFNLMITKHVLKMFIQWYLIYNVLELKQRKATWKIRQQLLIILRESLNNQSIMDADVCSSFFKIFNTVIEEDVVIGREIFLITTKIFKIYNVVLVNLANSINRPSVYYQQLPLALLQKIFQDLLFSNGFQSLEVYMQDRMQIQVQNQVYQLIQNYTAAAHLIIELSLHQQHHLLITRIVYKFISFIQNYTLLLHELPRKAFSKGIIIKNQIGKLRKISILVDCLLDVLYLNPNWRHSINQQKIQLSETNMFVKCKQRINKFAGGDIAQMMEQFTLQEQSQGKEIVWSHVYHQIIGESVIGRLCDVWMRELSSEL